MKDEGKDEGMKERMKERLKIVESEGKKKLSLRKEIEAKFERLWITDPDQFNPLHSSKERERIERTWSLLHEQTFNLETAIQGDKVMQDFESGSFAMGVDHSQKVKATPIANDYGSKDCVNLSPSIAVSRFNDIVDLGCGWGVFSRRLAQHGAHVDAVDIAENALKHLHGFSDNLTAIQDFVPQTRLEDEKYDLVLSTDLIAFLPNQLHRLYFSELARLIKSTGVVVCSTPLDIDSEDALERFAQLAETEFTVSEWIFSYHALYIRFLNLLKAPERFSKAAHDLEFRLDELATRRGFNKKWFHWNSRLPLAWFWKGISYLTSPLVKRFEQSRFILIKMESMTRFLLGERGISHAIFIGVRRQMIEPPPDEAIPVERKQRKQVWE